jgi:Helix-turn-helix domain
MGDIRMSPKERRRMELMARVRDGQLALVAVAELLPLSYRQTKRLWRRYRTEGDAGLVHRLRGRSSSRGIAPNRRRAILKLYQHWYADFGPTLAAEQLAKRDGHHLDHETLRRWLIHEGLWQRRRKRQRHRQWRERKPHVGELVQLDGSEHDWFEGRGPRAVLLVLIDDATNRTYARFYEAEDTRAAFDLFGRYYDRYGLPLALYPDRDSIYRVNLAATDEPPAAAPVTQFARAMKQLGVAIITAHSPQAKGRVERRHGVFQDRLVKELRLAGSETLAAANRYLEDTFLPDLNARFTVRPAAAADLHRRLPRGVRLDEVLCWEERRLVARDWTVRYQGQYWQIDRRHVGLSLVGQRVVVRTLLDGRRQLLYRGQKLVNYQLPARPQPPPTPLIARRSNAPRTNRPATDHPWRQWGIAVGRNFRRGGAEGGGFAPTPPPSAPNNHSNVKQHAAERGHF